MLLYPRVYSALPFIRRASDQSYNQCNRIALLRVKKPDDRIYFIGFLPYKSACTNAWPFDSVIHFEPGTDIQPFSTYCALLKYAFVSNITFTTTAAVIQPRFNFLVRKLQNSFFDDWARYILRLGVQRIHCDFELADVHS